MNYLRPTLLKACFLGFLGIAIIYGCKKSELPSEEELKAKTSSNVPPPGDDPLPEDPPPPLGPNIEVLKAYMSSLINVDVSEISYDANSAQFIVFGVPQISLTDLSSSYSDSINVQ